MEKEFAEFMEINALVKNIIDEMTEAANLSGDFADDFYNRIINDGPVLNEFITYLQTQKLLCEEKVSGYSIVDILVWQVDHFKAFLDRGDEMNKYNECEMILKAFDTFMKMKANPEKYIRMISEESGSDYDGKF